MEAAETEVLLMRRAMTWPGGELHLHADTRRGLRDPPYHCSGVLRVAVLDEDRRSITMFARDESMPFRGNTEREPQGHVVQWRVSQRMDGLKGRRIRLALYL